MQIKNRKDVQVGNYVKLTIVDKKGKFSYIGEVTDIVSSEDRDWIVLTTMIGTMHLDIHKNEMEITQEVPVGWKKFRANPDKFLEDQRKKEHTKEIEIAASTKTLKEKVLEYVKANAKKKDATLIKECSAEFKAAPELVKVQVQLARLRLGKVS